MLVTPCGMLALVVETRAFYCVNGSRRQAIAKHTKVDMIWVAGRSPTLVSQNLKATTLTYLAIVPKRTVIAKMMRRFSIVHTTE